MADAKELTPTEKNLASLKVHTNTIEELTKLQAAQAKGAIHNDVAPKKQEPKVKEAK